MLADVEEFDTPLTRELNQFGKQLSLVIMGMAGIMVVIGGVIHDFARDDLIDPHERGGLGLARRCAAQAD